MRFLNLDLDFFLNKSAYCSECESGRLGSEYKPWSASKVRRFLEERCGLSPDAPVKGRTVESHDQVFDFWCTLIEFGDLRVPFEVIHIDAHPDLWVGYGLYRIPGFLYVESQCRLAMLNRKHVHSGNYLTFAIVCGWIASLLWVSLRRQAKGLSEWDGDARSTSIQFKKRKSKSHIKSLPTAERDPGVPFKILAWHEFRTSESFDYIAFSKSPNFTPPESDELIPVIERYIRQI
jgi:hypothetical protein